MFMEPCLRAFALEIDVRRSASFGSIFEDASFKGYDMYNGNVVDYGNVAYIVFFVRVFLEVGDNSQALGGVFVCIPYARPALHGHATHRYSVRHGDHQG